MAEGRRRPGDTEAGPHVCVAIKNTGRGAIQVRSVYFEPEPQWQHRLIEKQGLQWRFPFVLAGLSTEMVAFDAEQLAQAIAAGVDASVGSVQATATVWLGNGDRVKATGTFDIRVA
jgi:hypothetical protein